MPTKVGFTGKPLRSRVTKPKPAIAPAGDSPTEPLPDITYELGGNSPEPSSVDESTAIDAVLGFFTPIGFGTGIVKSGLTTALILERMKEIILDRDLDPRITGDFIRQYYDMARESLRLGGYIKGNQTRSMELITTPTGITAMRAIESDTSRLSEPSLASASGAALATEAALLDALGPHAARVVEAREVSAEQSNE